LYDFCDKFGKLENEEIAQTANFAFQYRNAGLVKYTYTAVQLTLFEITNLMQFL